MRTIPHPASKRLLAMRDYALLLGLILAICTSVFGEALPEQRWVARYTKPLNASDNAHDLKVDGSGNVYVTGSSYDNGTDVDYATIKYSPDGNELWVARYNGPGNGADSASALVVDNSGNVYVTGFSTGSGTSFDYATVKYNSDGNQLWVARYNGPGNSSDKAYALAVDSSRNVYVTGYSYGSGTGYDCATIKYNSDGNQLWVARYNGPGNDYDDASAIAVDNSGNVYVTGESWGSGTYYDYGTIKYSPDGNELWVARYNGPSSFNDHAYTLAVDSSGNVYVTGESEDSGTSDDYATVKYSPDGNQLWATRYNGPSSTADVALAMAVNDSGNVYITGYSGGSGTSYDYATIKYNADGNQLWVARYNGPGNGQDSATSLAADNSGNVYITGQSPGSGTGSDYATVKYSPDGNQLWVVRYNGPANSVDTADTLAVDSSGNVYVTGSSRSSGTFDDYATIKYTQGPRCIYVDANATGANNGSSWANAYKYLQDALAAAEPNDKIWVAQGAYQPDEDAENPSGTGDRTATFQLENGVAIYGGFPTGGGTWASRNPNTYKTILSGDLNQNDEPNFINNGENSYNVVVGSGTDSTAILDGFTITAGDANKFDEELYQTYRGGGMYNNNGSPTVTNCTFSGNWGDNGGGMHNRSGSNPTVTNCIFIGNSATGGGGMWNNGSNPVLTDCSFIGNSVSGNGGAIYNYPGSSPMLTSCTFIGNLANSSKGGGLYNRNSTPTLTNCSFSGNSAKYGGGMYNDEHGSTTVTNCILWNNTAPAGAEIYNDGTSSVTVSYSDVQGGWAGTGNINADPLIWDTRGHLLSNSPCRNAGDPNGDYSGQTDMDGQPRVIDGRVDIGADESLPPIKNIDTGATYNTIQQAINDANNGETIVVQPGTYTGPGNRGIDFNGKAITLRSAEPNDPNVVAATITDCNGNYETGFYFQNGEGPNSVLNGFTITNGIANVGGGIYCSGSSPTIKNCILRDNTAWRGGGIYCQNSNPTIDGGTIRDNSPDGIYVDANSSVLILGVVHIISNDIAGAGTLQMGSGGSLDLDNAKVFCNMSGPGTVTVALGAEATIDGNSIIDLSDPCDPNVKGTIDCEGFLKVKDNAQITNAKINITMAAFEDYAYISNSEIHVDSKAPYGSVFAEPNTSFVDVNIYADGDRYMDLDPSIFDGSFVNVKIFVTITEGVGQLRGGLLECRGDVNFANVNSCDPNNEFFCRANPGTISDCNTKTWTLERLELIPGAKLTLTNRFPFQPPYDPGNDNDVVYVKELILRPGSVLNTSYNKIYYGSLIIEPNEPNEPNAVIKNEPLLGFSLINIAMDDPNEFIVRVTHNNYTDYNDPNHNRVHIERVEGLSPDPNGMMRMSNLLDLDSNSPDYNDTINARAKGLFSKSSEDEILILFEYLFGAADPNTELVIYLSDIPELGDVNDPNDYVEVARLLPPLPGQPGSVGNNEFGVFKQSVPKDGLNFIRGTRIEFTLLGGSGVYMYINNWDPGNCDCGTGGICLDLTCGNETDAEDFVNLLSTYGTASNCSGMFGNSGTLGSTEMCGWDWGSSSGLLNCCGPLPLTGSSPTSCPTLSSFSGTFNSLLACGKKKMITSTSDVMKDGLYAFSGSGQYSNKLTPALNRANIRLVEDFDGDVYQINSRIGILRLDSNEVIVGSGQFSDINEPRYGTSATVYVGIQKAGNSYSGRPIFDAAFDPDFADNNYVYIVPVVVKPKGKEPYTATAKLELKPNETPPYSIVQLYDDPDANKPGDNRDVNELREVEVDTAGNLYVLNARYNYNKSDILWKYNASSGAMIERLVLGDPNSEANYVPSPTAMYLSTAQDMLYLAPSFSPVEANSSKIYGFSTGSGTLTRARTIDVNGMGHVTGITENPTTGTLWVAGFSMKLPVGHSPSAFLYNSYLCPFYEPNLAEVPIGSDDVNAICTSSDDPNNDLALPLSIVWTGAISLPEKKCGGADLYKSGDVDLKDFSAFAQHWLETGCVVPGWCGGADLDPYIRNRGQVDLVDLAIFVHHWLESGCLE